MVDYIEREGLLDEISAARDNDGMGAIVAGTLTRYIKRAPAADVRPVVRGRWEFVKGSNGKEYMVCSECRVQQDLSALFTYCPNCGAIMVWED